jgi:CheY-like chemotaxis protein
MRPSQRIIAIAEDDQDDRVLTRDAFAESRLNPELVFFGDGEALMTYLHASISGVADAGALPAMILLDLNMPKVDGREALEAIRSDPRLKHLPVIVISTSRSDLDVVDLYQRGANAFIRKPSSFDQLVQALNALELFWFRTANLPVLETRPR